jgi:hypothetical protein
VLLRVEVIVVLLTVGIVAVEALVVFTDDSCDALVTSVILLLVAV